MIRLYHETENIWMIVVNEKYNRFKLGRGGWEGGLMTKLSSIEKMGMRRHISKYDEKNNKLKEISIALKRDLIIFMMEKVVYD